MELVRELGYPVKYIVLASTQRGPRLAPESSATVATVHVYYIYIYIYGHILCIYYYCTMYTYSYLCISTESAAPRPWPPAPRSRDACPAAGRAPFRALSSRGAGVLGRFSFCTFDRARTRRYIPRQRYVCLQDQSLHKEVLLSIKCRLPERSRIQERRRNKPNIVFVPTNQHTFFF